jgi:hypothetical protein
MLSTFIFLVKILCVVFLKGLVIRVWVMVKNGFCLVGVMWLYEIWCLVL